MRILLAASEVTPFAKTGGLADVAGSLPAALARLGHRPCVFTPYYSRLMRGGARVKETARLIVPTADGGKEAHVLEGSLPGTDVPVYFVARREFFGRDGVYGSGSYSYADNLERYAFFCRAVCVAARELELDPDVFHINDWQTALISAHLRHLYAGDRHLSGAAVVFTVHNLGYQGIFPPWRMPATGLPPERFNWQELEFYGQLNLLKGGLVYSDAINTVSKRYAREIQTLEGGYGLDGVLRGRSERLFGIVNGLDYSVWDPAVDHLLPARYGPGRRAGKARCSRELRERMGLDPGRRPLLGMVSRLAEQKGLDILIGAIPAIMEMPVQLAVLGSGEDHFERALVYLADRYPGRLSVRLGHDEELAHLVEAGSSIYLMPSRYEPCGLNQLISLRYGTIPVVRETGGLADTITDGANGFTFTDYSPDGLVGAVRRAVSAMGRRKSWGRMVDGAMREDWSWDRSAGEYVRLYELARAERGLPPSGRARRGRGRGAKTARTKTGRSPRARKAGAAARPRKKK